MTVLSDDITLLQFHKMSLGTKLYNHPAYPYLKLSGEAGEVSEKYGKILRDKAGVISKEDKQELLKELGDVLWYICAIADDLGSSLDIVGRMNLDKLLDRQKRGTLRGSGDNR